jgi:hypothetical protein
VESAIRGSGAFAHIGFDPIQSHLRHLRCRRESPAVQVVASSVEFIRMLFARVEQGSTPFGLYLNSVRIGRMTIKAWPGTECRLQRAVYVLDGISSIARVTAFGARY